MHENPQTSRNNVKLTKRRIRSIKTVYVVHMFINWRIHALRISFSMNSRYPHKYLHTHQSHFRSDWCTNHFVYQSFNETHTIYEMLTNEIRDGNKRQATLTTNTTKKVNLKSFTTESWQCLNLFALCYMANMVISLFNRLYIGFLIRIEVAKRSNPAE